MIHNGFGRTIVIAQHEDILVVGFHEIALAGYPLHRLRVGLQFPDLCLIALEGSIVSPRLFRQLINTLEVLDVTPYAVLIKEANDQHTGYAHHRILQKLRAPGT